MSEEVKKILGETMCITSKELHDYVNSFDNAIDAFVESTKVIDEFRNDITELCKSMSNLYHENKIPLAMNDTYIEVTLCSRGSTIMKSVIGIKDFTSKVTENFNKRVDAIEHIREKLGETDSNDLAELLLKKDWSAQDTERMHGLLTKLKADLERSDDTDSTE